MRGNGISGWPSPLPRLWLASSVGDHWPSVETLGVSCILMSVVSTWHPDYGYLFDIMSLVHTIGIVCTTSVICTSGLVHTMRFVCTVGCFSYKMSCSHLGNLWCYSSSPPPLEPEYTPKISTTHSRHHPLRSTIPQRLSPVTLMKAWPVKHAF